MLNLFIRSENKEWLAPSRPWSIHVIYIHKDLYLNTVARSCVRRNKGGLLCCVSDNTVIMIVRCKCLKDSNVFLRKSLFVFVCFRKTDTNWKTSVKMSRHLASECQSNRKRENTSLALGQLRGLTVIVLFRY